MGLMGIDETYGFKEDWTMGDLVLHLDKFGANYYWLFVTIDPARGEEMRAKEQFIQELAGHQIQAVWYDRSLIVAGEDMKRILLFTSIVNTFDAVFLFSDGPLDEPAYYIKDPKMRFDQEMPEKLRDEIVRCGGVAFFMDKGGLNFYSREKELTVKLREIFSKI